MLSELIYSLLNLCEFNILAYHVHTAFLVLKPVITAAIFKPAGKVSIID